MANAWSLSFKKRMLQLEMAVMDIDTKKIYLAEDYGDIHHTLFDRMNHERFLSGSPVHDIPATMCFDDWPGRGFIRKDTGEFMQANAAAEWASKFAMNMTWDGESNRLRRKQREFNGTLKDWET